VRTIAPIDERDIGSVAAVALLAAATPRLSGACPVLSGPGALTLQDQARSIAAAIGAPVRFEEIDAEALIADLVRAGEPRWAAEGLMRYFDRATRDPVPVTTAVGDITGTPPRPFEQWIADHVDKLPQLNPPQREPGSGVSNTPFAAGRDAAAIIDPR
jgi:hypothetical protein